ncbi:MAG TPA: amidohydrolase family protein [Burkholderiales bacterium]|nr:amidohydrolase family protein [Burkholderiales bacterium]
MAEQRIILDHSSVLDVVAGKLLPDRRVIIRGGTIERVEPSRAQGGSTEGATVIDVKGRTVMPGLCDAHVHVTAWTADLQELARVSPFYSAARAGAVLNDMLMRGFTTVRDAGGADFGLAQAVKEGRIAGPRILFCGRGLSQTGGHGDTRGRGEEVIQGVGSAAILCQVCDGVDAVRSACRNEIRKGASHLKLMLSGGVVSPTDRLTNTQFSEDEIRAAVEEADMAGLYCMAHTYTARAVNRAILCGVHSLEHCNLIDETSVELFVKHGAWMVPTLATYDVLGNEGGYPEDVLAKLAQVKDHGLHALEIAAKGRVKLAYGTDLLGPMHKHQLREFALRSAVQPAVEVVRAATCYAADLFREAGRTGVVAEGARADLLVVDGDPLKDLACLQDPEHRLLAIIKDGLIQKNRV